MNHDTPPDPPEESGQSGPRVRLLIRDGCHLCEDARIIVSAVCTELGERFEEIDIDADDDPRLTAKELAQLGRYSDEVPVTFVDGRQHDFWRVDPHRLRAALAVS